MESITGGKPVLAMNELPLLWHEILRLPSAHNSVHKKSCSSQCCTVLTLVLVRVCCCKVEQKSLKSSVYCGKLAVTAKLVLTGSAISVKTQKGSGLGSDRPDIQDPAYINSCIPQPSHQTSRIYTPPPFFIHTSATQTDYQNSLRRPRFPMLCSCCLELSEH